MNKPFPPYGSIVKELFRFNPTTPIYLYCGKDALTDAQKTIKKSQVCTCLPFTKKIDDYEWPVAGGAIILCDTGGLSIEFLHEFAIVLLQNGARQVTLYTELTAIKIFNQKDLTHD